MKYDRSIIIGDVHGCLEELTTLIEAIAPRPGRDRVIFLGDIVDKGPYSYACLTWVYDFLKLYPGSQLIMGNHEIQWIKKSMRGETILGMTRSLYDWLRDRPMFVRLPEHQLFLCHGGIYPKFFEEHGAFEAVDAQWHPVGRRGKDVQRLAYARQVRPDGGYAVLSDATPGMVHWSAVYDGREGFVVYGHEPSPDVRISPHAVGIDTGCCFGGHLTALVFPEAHVYQTKALRAYAEHPLWGGAQSDDD